MKSEKVIETVGEFLRGMGFKGSIYPEGIGGAEGINMIDDEGNLVTVSMISPESSLYPDDEEILNMFEDYL